MTKAEKEKNLRIWSQVEETPPSHTKRFKGHGGVELTTVDAQYQRKVATELWGPIGGLWGVRDEIFQVVAPSEDPHDTLLVYNGRLFYPNSDAAGDSGLIPLVSSINLYQYSRSYESWTMVGDPYKKVKTDALTKGLSELGFSADIFLGLFDDNKYLQRLREKEAKAQGPGKREEYQERYHRGFDTLKEALGLSAMQLIHRLEGYETYPKERDENKWGEKDAVNALNTVGHLFKETQQKEGDNA